MTLRRKARIRPSNAKRRRAKYERNFSGGIGHDSWIRNWPCLICVPGMQERPTEAAHIRDRGMGGVKGCWRDLIPLCRRHHHDLDVRLGKEGFARLHDMDLEAVAAGLVEEHLYEIGEADEL